MPDLLALVIQYRYAILFPLAFFEGPIVSFVIGMLIARGYFNVPLAYTILILGDLIPDTAYYLLGRYGERKTLISRYAAKIGIKENHFGAIRKLWHNHPGKTMFFSKLAYGLSTPFLVFAGVVGMPVKKFISYALPVTLIQYALLMALGYYFGGSFNIIAQSFKDIQIIIVAIIALAFGYYLLQCYMRKKLLQEEKKEEERMV
ncbi:MAG: hypothetical protein Q8Q94_00085 [bacterium]|nr:hypothetical protein [bacterium]MDZ4299365.1 hypothetical protein [Candidatus Sungbacteria bacterium]